jgi:hypothetical protein
LKGADRAAVSGAGVELRFGRFGLLAGDGLAAMGASRIRSTVMRTLLRQRFEAMAAKGRGTGS